LGIGDWGLGIGDWANPQSPIPNPQSPIPKIFFFILESVKFKIFIYKINYYFMKNKLIKTFILIFL